MIYALILGGLLTSPAEQDSKSWPVYLDTARLRGLVDEQVVNWEACEGSGASSGLSVEIRLGGSGQVQEVSSSTKVEPCWMARLQALEFSEHPEAELEFHLSLLTKNGKVLSILALNRIERTRMPPFLHLPASLSASQRKHIIEALGLASGPVAE